MKSAYKLDRSLGLDYFITDTLGIGGRLRTDVEDFVVEELPIDLPLEPSGEHTHFTLEKRNWETMGAVRAIARALGVSHKRFGYAGTKDKRALTRQRVSAWRVEPEHLSEVNIKDIRLYDFVRSSERLSLGDSMGNSFKIVIRDARLAGAELENEIATACEQMAEKGVPNYFGYQRFGITRPNTHLVGKELVKGNLEEAVMRYLGYPYDAEGSESRRARQYFDETRDPKGALELYPKKLGYERSMLDALMKNPRDYAGALRRLPKKLRTMLVHAYQAYLFNKLLSWIIEGEKFEIGMMLPLLGYRTQLDGVLGDIAANILEEEELSLRSFFIKSMPEISSPGENRKAGLEVAPEYNVGESSEGTPLVEVSFSLPKGSYATVVLREIMKAEPKNY